MKPINKRKIILSAAVIAGCCILFGFSSVNALDNAAQLKLGEMEYLSNCASCHGKDARGDGPVATVLSTKPTDLTTIAKNLNDEFPKEHVYRIIDGRNMIKPHGNRVMPVWGNHFTVMEYQATDAIAYPLPDIDIQSMVFGRITSLVRYLESIQIK